MLAQEIITLLSETYDDTPTISLFAGSIFTNTGNPQSKNWWQRIIKVAWHWNDCFPNQ